MAQFEAIFTINSGEVIVRKWIVKDNRLIKVSFILNGKTNITEDHIVDLTKEFVQEQIDEIVKKYDYLPISKMEDMFARGKEMKAKIDLKLKQIEDDI